MAGYNKVLLMGNLTRDPELKYLPNQTAAVDFGIACNRKYTTASGEQREEVTFVDCTAYAQTGETINQYFTKGKAMFIEGRLKYDTWDDKNGGGRRSKLSVVVDRFEFIDAGGNRSGNAGGGGDGGGYAGNDQPQQPRQQQRQAPQRPQPQQQRQQPQQQTLAPAAGSRQSAPVATRPQPQRPAAAPLPENEGFTDADIPF